MTEITAILIVASEVKRRFFLDFISLSSPPKSQICFFFPSPDPSVALMNKKETKAD